MPRPGDMDTDPNLGRLSWEVLLRIDPTAPFAAGAGPAISTAIKNRTGVAPLSVTVGADGTASVVLPADRPVDQWVAYVASGMATIPRTGTVTGLGDRCRVS